MKTATTQSDRLALIKEIAERKKKMSKIRKQSHQLSLVPSLFLVRKKILTFLKSLTCITGLMHLNMPKNIMEKHYSKQLVTITIGIESKTLFLIRLCRGVDQLKALSRKGC